MNAKQFYTKNNSSFFNAKKQKEIIENQETKTLFINLNNQLQKLKEKLFCKVNTKENVLKTIELIRIEINKRTINCYKNGFDTQTCINFRSGFFNGKQH